MFFRVKNSAKLTKLMDIYCEKRGLKPKTVQFIYNHRRITRRHTPAGLQMKDGDEIDAMLHFNGGGYKASKHEEI
ncbi:unnamed protein product [Dovyalis caffra]|uniref:Rad60/SUMO-like domain-containing protein n=1 Tax=Dovyalis caffra TaxID=77055 RepID=A0AAV1R5Z8_9ROSI|nr:unnamed protein product [Dovyalis caffra]